MIGRMPASSNTSMTPICAKPRAAPPPRARPMRGARGGVGAGATTAGGAGGVGCAMGGL
jgi:hypothetical protein